jgi:hypothetical protein
LGRCAGGAGQDPPPRTPSGEERREGFGRRQRRDHSQCGRVLYGVPVGPVRAGPAPQTRGRDARLVKRCIFLEPLENAAQRQAGSDTESLDPAAAIALKSLARTEQRFGVRLQSLNTWSEGRVGL